MSIKKYIYLWSNLDKKWEGQLCDEDRARFHRYSRLNAKTKLTYD